MNISNDTSNKIKELLNHPDATIFKNMVGNISADKLLETFKQINPSESDIKKAEDKIKSMSKEELISELMKKMKG